MSEILDLRQKRANLWDETKKFLDNAKRDGDVLSAEDAAAYEKMESDIVALGREIDMLERQAEIEKQLNAPVNTPVLGTPKTGGDTKTGRASDEYKNAFWKAMQNKYTYSVHDALQIGTDSEGGYLVPDEFEATLIDRLSEENFIRNLATIITSSNGDKKIPVVASHGAAIWVDEEGEYTEDDDVFATVTLGAHKLSSIIKVSEELLNDAAFNLETYIAQEFARRMSAAEELAFISGDGSSKPTGLITSGETGVTAASSTAITADEVTILNRPVYTSSCMPEIAGGNKVMLFGDMSYYWIADRQGRSFQRLNELFAKNGQVGFRVFQRVDGKLTLPEAVKTLEMGA